MKWTKDERIIDEVITMGFMGFQVTSDDGCRILFDSRWKYPEDFGCTKGTAEYDGMKQMYYENLHLALPQFEIVMKGCVEDAVLVDKDGSEVQIGKMPVLELVKLFESESATKGFSK